MVGPPQRKGRYFPPARLLCLGWVVWSGASWAAAPASLAVIPFSQASDAPSGVGAKFAQQVSAELQSSPSLQLTPSQGKGKAVDPLAAPLAEANRLMSELRFEEAASVLKAGVDAAMADASHVTFQQLTEAQLQLAVASFRQGDDRAVARAFELLTTWSLTYKPAAVYPAAFLRELEKARKKVAKAPMTSVLIEGPEGASVKVDGRSLGALPLPPQPVRSGIHLVQITGDRAEVWGKAVELKAAARGKAQASVLKVAFGTQTTSAEDAKMGPKVDGDTLVRLKSHAEASGAEFVLIGYLARSGEHQLAVGTALYSAARNSIVLMPTTLVDRELLTSKVEAFRLADDIVKRVVAFGEPAALPAVLVVDAPPPAPKRPPASSEPEWLPSGNKSPVASAQPLGSEAEAASVASGSRWYWWVLGGVAVAAAASGATYGIIQANKPASGTVTATW